MASAEGGRSCGGDGGRDIGGPLFTGSERCPIEVVVGVGGEHIDLSQQSAMPRVLDVKGPETKVQADPTVKAVLSPSLVPPRPQRVTCPERGCPVGERSQIENV